MIKHAGTHAAPSAAPALRERGSGPAPHQATKAELPAREPNRPYAPTSAPHGSTLPGRTTLFPPTVSLRTRLERDKFLNSFICDLVGSLQDAVGPDEAADLVGSLGRQIGRKINNDYKSALSIDEMSTARVAEVLVDLNRRLHGDFYIIEQDADKIVFGNWVCPFGRKVAGRPAMCMMTSNVFGSIAAENLDYARVVLEKTIAEGASGCRIVVHLRKGAGGDTTLGREYFKGEEDPRAGSEARSRPDA